MFHPESGNVVDVLDASAEPDWPWPADEKKFASRPRAQLFCFYMTKGETVRCTRGHYGFHRRYIPFNCLWLLSLETKNVLPFSDGQVPPVGLGILPAAAAASGAATDDPSSAST
jgi:hypothetical protein